METQTSPDEEKTFFREYGAILISCVFLIVTLLYGYITGSVITDRGHTSHLLSRIFRQFPLIIFVLFLGVIWLFGIVIVAGRGKVIQKWIVGFLILAASGILSLCMFIRVMTLPFIIIENVTTDLRAYYLTFNAGYLGDPGWYSLDECNLTGLTCQILYTSDINYPDTHDDAELIRDNDAQIISVLIDGEVVYTYTVK